MRICGKKREFKELDFESWGEFGLRKVMAYGLGFLLQLIKAWGNLVLGIRDLGFWVLGN